jgi:hypothetical protein
MRVLLTLSVVVLAAGCGRTPLNGTPGLIADGGEPADGNGADVHIPDGGLRFDAQQDAPVHWDGPLDGPRPDGPRPDGPRDGAGDARPDGARDGGGDARQDGGQRDAQQDAQTDGAQQDGSTPGVIECGNTTCDAATQQCCVTFQGASCIARGAQCQGAVATCDGPEDCGGTTPICCGRTNGSNRGLRCSSANQCNGARVCHLDADCASGQKCCVEATIAGYTVLTCAASADCPYVGPGVVCGAMVCSSSQVCCVSYNGATCSSGGCSGGSLPVRCDGPEDCGGGTPVCCGDISSGTSCVASGSCASSYTGGVVCHTSADCPSGRTCTDVPFGGLRVCL